MVITVTIVMMVKVTFYEVAGVIAMRNSFVSAFFAVHVAGLVSLACVLTTESVLVYMITMLMVEVTIMKVISVITMLDCCVSAGRRMLVVMVTVCFAVAHCFLRLRILRLLIW